MLEYLKFPKWFWMKILNLLDHEPTQPFNLESFQRSLYRAIFVSVSNQVYRWLGFPPWGPRFGPCGAAWNMWLLLRIPRHWQCDSLSRSKNINKVWQMLSALFSQNLFKQTDFSQILKKISFRCICNMSGVKKSTEAGCLHRLSSGLCQLM